MFTSLPAVVTALVLSPAQRLHTQHLQRAGTVSALQYSAELPEMYRKRWIGGTTEGERVTQEIKPAAASINAPANSEIATIFGALLGTSVAAALGAGVSTLQVDQTLRQLEAAGMFDQDVLITDTLVNMVDSATQVGWILIPLTLLYLARPTITAREAVDALDTVFDDVEACLVETQLCGPASFDSTEDGMVCVEDHSRGYLSWECA